MADNETGQEDKTEDATPERREEFREKGQVVVSRELTQVFILAATVIFFTWQIPSMINTMQRMFVTSFEGLSTKRINEHNILDFATATWIDVLKIIIPIFGLVFVIAVSSTLLQTRFNWSWERMKPDFSRMNPWQGLVRMISMQATVELIKSTAKMLAVSTVTYLILQGEWVRVPGLMNFPMQATWAYWGDITKTLFWAVAGFLLVIAGADYLYNFISQERRMRMTKQEVKEEYKRREVDPHVKARMRRMQRDIVMRKTVEKTKKATVLITNPTHYAIAVSYEFGDPAPKLIAKGIDFIALQMREVAKEEKIPIIENRKLARELYATVEEGEEIPDKFYRAVAEIIRYVFKLKGRKIPNRNNPKPEPAPTGGN